MKPLLTLATLLALPLFTGCTTDDVIAATRGPLVAPAIADARRASPSALERSLHRRVDEYRTSRGLPPLAFNSKMTELAREHSRDMARRGRIDHQGYNTRIAALRNSGAASTATENVAHTRGAPDVTRSMLQYWINSPPHRSNMTRAEDRKSGVGFAQGSDGSWYATQLFGN